MDMIQNGEKCSFESAIYIMFSKAKIVVRQQQIVHEFSDGLSENDQILVKDAAIHNFMFMINQKIMKKCVESNDW